MQSETHMDEKTISNSPWNSLRFSLLAWFMFLSLSPIMLTSLLDYYQTKNSLKVSAQKELKQSAKLSQQFIDNWFDYRFMEINTQAQLTGTYELLITYETAWKNEALPLPDYVKSKEWEKITKENLQDLAAFKQNFDYIYDVFLIDLQGNILFTFAEETDLGENIINGKYSNTKFSSSVQDAIQSRQATFSGIERYAPSNNIIAGFLSAPIFDSNEKLIGVFAVQLSLDRIFDAFKTTANEDRPIKHYLVGNDQLLRTPIHNDWNDVLKTKIDTVNVNQWIDSAAKGLEHTPFSIRGYQGPTFRVIGTNRQIKAGKVNWLLVSEMNESDALSASKIMLNTMLITVLVMTLIALIASYFIARKFTQPITALARSSANFAKGKSQKIESSNSSNEINQLISSFNTMIDLRKTHEQQLEMSEQDFQRTRELLEEQKYALDQHSLVAITDIKGTITFANKKFSDVSGYSIEELIGSNHRILNSGKHDLLFWKNMFKTVLAGETWRNEVCNKAKDGSLYWVDTTIVPFMDKNQRPQSYIAIRTDITHKKLTEFALAESSNQLKLVIENASLGIWDWGIQDNTISFNDRWAEIIGYTLQELEPITLETWLTNCHPEDLVESGEKLEKYWAGEINEYSMEARMKHKSGEWVWVYSSGKVVSWDEERKPIRMVGIHLEITDRKNAEYALANSEAQSRGIFNSVADGIISLDASGTITALNPAGEKIFKYNSNDIIGRNITALMPNSYRDSHLAGFENFQKLGKSNLTNKTIEVEGLRSDGAIFPLELAISKVQVENEYNFTAMMRDISERKLIESQQQHQHELVQVKFSVAETLAEQLSMEKRSVKALQSISTLKFLSNIAYSGVMILETNQDDIDSNTPLLKWYSQESLPKRDLQLLEALTLTCLDKVNNNKNNIHFEHSINQNSNHYLIPIFSMGSNDNGLGVIVFSASSPQTDIEENIAVLNEISDLFAAAIVQNNARHLLKKASLIAEQNSNLKSEFLASMSHEIRTPMNGVLGMLGLLLNSQLNKDQEDKVHLAKSSAESLLTLINDILDFSKVEAGKLELEIIDFDLRKMLGDFSDAMALHAQEKNIELILDVKDIDQSMVKGDSGRIRQILTNLVSNAIKFTPTGEIVIRVATITKSQNKLTLSCSISDTGIGIPENKIALLFDKFTQVDASTTREYGGTGLGLAITKKLCLLMGGDIHVTSELNKGSTFAFEIDIESSDKSTQVLPTFNIKNLNILVVDDNKTNREVVNGQLTHWGANVFEADCGKNAIECCEQYALKHTNKIFDIALLDMQMPEMDGAELGKLLHARYKDMKLVMMTSISTKNENQFFADIGFSAYFTKPATTSDLFDTLAILSDNGDTLKQASPLVTSDYIHSLKREDQSVSQQHKYTWPKSTRLLIVEDNRINQHVALGILQEFNLTADIAGNGLEAISAIESAPENDPYTLVLMDCQMPEMDGYDATKAIRNSKAGDKHKSITIIAMTANAMEGDKEKCLNVGMNDYLSKPIEAEQLLSTLQHWLIEKSGLNVADFVKTESDSNTTQAVVKQQHDTPTPPSSNNGNKSQTTENDQDNIIEKVAWDTETALSRVRGNTKLLAKLVTMYLEDMPGHVKELHDAVKSQDIELSKRTAHSIRGASGNLYAYRMQDLAKSIETHIIENPNNVNFTELSNTTALFDQEFATLQQLLEIFITENV